MKVLRVLLFGWYVVTYQGQSVAGPFLTFGDCNRIARQIRNANPVCQYRY